MPSFSAAPLPRFVPIHADLARSSAKSSWNDALQRLTGELHRLAKPEPSFEEMAAYGGASSMLGARKGLKQFRRGGRPACFRYSVLIRSSAGPSHQKKTVRARAKLLSWAIRFGAITLAPILAPLPEHRSQWRNLQRHRCHAFEVQVSQLGTALVPLAWTDEKRAVRGNQTTWSSAA